jgi:hypothetical protein
MIDLFVCPLLHASHTAGKLAHKLLLRNLQLRAMPGRWVCLYDGEGTIDLQFDAKVRINICILLSKG